MVILQVNGKLATFVWIDKTEPLPLSRLLFKSLHHNSQTIRSAYLKLCSKLRNLQREYTLFKLFNFLFLSGIKT